VSHVDYHLKLHEVLLCAVAGAMRHVEDMKLARREKYDAPTEGVWDRHVEGCIGELVIAKHLWVPWVGKGVLRGPDAGDSEQVRTGMKLSHSHLILHKDDADDLRYWLVCGSGLHYRVHGWLLGRDGKQQKYWGDPFGKNRPAFWVPASDLHPPEVP
jgi:hypothetical protein